MNDVEQFAALISKWKNVYVSVVRSYVGLKTPAGASLVCGKVLLSQLPHERLPAAFQFEVDHIVAGRYAAGLDTAALQDVVSKASAGELVTTAGSLVVP